MTETREGREKELKISVRFPDTLPLGPQPAERLTCGAMRSLVDGPMLLRSRAAGSKSPVPCSSPNMVDGSRLRPPGERGRLLRSLSVGSLLDPGARQRVFRPTCSSIAPAPPLRAATGGLRYFLLPDLLSTAIPLSSEGSLTACPSFLLGFGTNVTRFVGRKEEDKVGS